MAIVKNDRFGNPQAIVALKDKKGNGFPKGYVEIKNTLFRVETQQANKDGVDVWVTLTQVKKNVSNNGAFTSSNKKF